MSIGPEVCRLIRAGCVAHDASPHIELVVPAHALARLLPAPRREEGAMNDEEFLEEVAARLDDLVGAPIETLFDLVARGRLVPVDPRRHRGADVDSDKATDREWAAKICAGCPVADECLELEFRTAGFTTLGVWGALAEEDRRAAYLAWLQHQDGDQR